MWEYVFVEIVVQYSERVVMGEVYKDLRTSLWYHRLLLVGSSSGVQSRRRPQEKRIDASLRWVRKIGTTHYDSRIVELFAERTHDSRSLILSHSIIGGSSLTWHLHYAGIPFFRIDILHYYSQYSHVLSTYIPPGSMFKKSYNFQRSSVLVWELVCQWE